MFAFYFVAALMLINSAMARNVDKRETRLITDFQYNRCGGSRMNIECYRNGIITIKSANYGRTEEDGCRLYRKETGEEDNGLSNAICLQDVSEIFEDACNGKNSCTVEVSEENLGSACNHVNKYTDVRYKCGYNW